MKRVTAKKKCAECEHCKTVLDPQKGSRHRCATKKTDLPDDVGSRPACRKFALPKISNWGP